MGLKISISFSAKADFALDREEMLEYIDSIFQREIKGEITVDLSLFFCNNEEIKSINREFRNVDKATDVLSFAYERTSKALNGEIIISIEKIREQANEYGHEYRREFF